MKDCMLNICQLLSITGGRREDDWTCPSCGNVNFSFRTTCNMRNCTQPRPADHNVVTFVLVIWCQFYALSFVRILFCRAYKNLQPSNNIREDAVCDFWTLVNFVQYHHRSIFCVCVLLFSMFIVHLFCEGGCLPCFINLIVNMCFNGLLFP